MKVELEITSDCNAACPGCARTLNKDKLEINSFSLTDLQRIFPTQDYTGYEFKFCGVLGDPIVNPDFLDMVWSSRMKVRLRYFLFRLSLENMR